MLSGTVDRLDTGGTFGFIIGPNGEEYFFHQSVAGLQGFRQVMGRELVASPCCPVAPWA